MAVYNNHLYDDPPMGRAAGTGFGYGTPVAIQALYIFNAEICCRIKGEWFVLDGFIRITYDASIDALEKFYQDEMA